MTIQTFLGSSQRYLSGVVGENLAFFRVEPEGWNINLPVAVKGLLST